MIKIGVGVKAKVVKSNHPSIKVGDERTLFQSGDRYESEGFMFDRNESGSFVMLLFRGGVLLEEL